MDPQINMEEALKELEELEAKLNGSIQEPNDLQSSFEKLK
jgi:hypothetical protein